MKHVLMFLAFKPRAINNHLKKPLCFAAAVPAQGTQVVTDTSFGFLVMQLVILINSEASKNISIKKTQLITILVKKYKKECNYFLK